MCYFNIPVFWGMNSPLTCQFSMFFFCHRRSVVADMRILTGNAEVHLGGCLSQDSFQFQGIEITHLKGVSFDLFIYLTIQEILMEHLVCAKNDGTVVNKTVSCLGILKEPASGRHVF